MAFLFHNFKVLPRKNKSFGNSFFRVLFVDPRQPPAVLWVLTHVFFGGIQFRFLQLAVGSMNHEINE